MSSICTFLVFMGTFVLALAKYPFCSVPAGRFVIDSIEATPQNTGHVGFTDLAVKIYSRQFHPYGEKPTAELCSGIILSPNFVVTTSSCLNENSKTVSDSIIVAGGWVSPATPFEVDLKNKTFFTIPAGSSGLTITGFWPGVKSALFSKFNEDQIFLHTISGTPPNGTQVLATGWGQGAPGLVDAVFATKFNIIHTEFSCHGFYGFDPSTMLCGYKEGMTGYNNITYPGGPVVLCDENGKEVFAGIVAAQFLDGYYTGNHRTWAVFYRIPDLNNFQEYKEKLRGLFRSGFE